MSLQEAKELRLIVRQWQATVMVMMKRYESCGMPQVRPEPPDAVKEASRRLGELRRARIKAKRAAWSEDQKAAYRASKKRSMAKKPEHYQAKKDAWAARNPESKKKSGREYMRRRRAAERQELAHLHAPRDAVHFEGGGQFAALYQAFGVGSQCLASDRQTGTRTGDLVS